MVALRMIKMHSFSALILIENSKKIAKLYGLLRIMALALGMIFLFKSTIQ
jgi:hypothetical protein